MRFDAHAWLLVNMTSQRAPRPCFVAPFQLNSACRHHIISVFNVSRHGCWFPADIQLWTRSSVRQEEGAGRQVLPAGASVRSGQAFRYGAKLTASCHAADCLGGQQQPAHSLQCKVRWSASGYTQTAVQQQYLSWCGPGMSPIDYKSSKTACYTCHCIATPWW